jgi:predicted TIM-barrel fold metal-dependent hydrolase
VIEDRPLVPSFDTFEHLNNARRQAEQRGLDDILIVDVDAHHYENEDWSEITEYMTADPVIKHMSEANLQKGNLGDFLIGQPANQDVSGRIRRYGGRHEQATTGSTTLEMTLQAMDAMGINYTVLFPTPMLHLSLHPRVDVEVAVARAYANWVIERVCSEDNRIKTMPYLPFNDPDASIAMVERYGDSAGVVGFMVTSVRYRPVHDNAYVPLYKALEERGLPIAFHSAWNWFERSFSQLTNFLSVHALGRPFYNMIHATNWVINGIPERFPGLRSIWIECGLSWLPFLT